jgi:hypothetical protein
MMFALPAWIDEVMDDHRYPEPEDQVLFAIDLARRNIAAETGGPFGG